MIVKIMFAFTVMLHHVTVKGVLVYEVPATAGCGEGQMFADLLLHAERLFSCFGSMTLRLH